MIENIQDLFKTLAYMQNHILKLYRYINIINYNKFIDIKSTHQLKKLQEFYAYSCIKICSMVKSTKYSRRIFKMMNLKVILNHLRKYFNHLKYFLTFKNY